jgi:hypothetical protein
MSIRTKTIPLREYNKLYANYGLLTHLLEEQPHLIEWLKDYYPKEFAKADIE